MWQTADCQSALRQSKLYQPMIALCDVFLPDGNGVEFVLFGYKAGSFTGALKSKKGLLEVADHGAIFLDEIGEMVYDLQAKLLRVLETDEYIKIGDTVTTRVDVRVISATNRDLKKKSEAGISGKACTIGSRCSVSICPLYAKGANISSRW